jgi:hypothetical protein
MGPLHKNNLNDVKYRPRRDLEFLLETQHDEHLNKSNEMGAILKLYFKSRHIAP